MDTEKRQSARRRGSADREAVRAGLADETRRGLLETEHREHSHGVAVARPRARRGRPAPRPRDRHLRRGIVGQVHARAARHRRGAEARRQGGLHRRRARPRPQLRRQVRRRHPGAVHLAARLRRAGAGDHRGAGALRRNRHRGGGQRRRAGAARRARRRHGRPSDGPAGPPHVPGAPQADRVDQPVEDLRDLHQPAAREGRRRLRQPRDHARRQGPQVLLVGAHRPAPAGDHQAWRRRHRQPRARQGGEEQGGPAVSEWQSSTSCSPTASARRATSSISA